MKIGIDVDDVLADFVAAHREIARGMFGRPEAGARPVDWDFSNYGLSHDELGEVWGRINATKNFWMGLERVPNVSCLPQLLADHEVFFISSRRPGAGLPLAVQTALWLEQAFPGVYRPVVLITKNKRDRALLADALELDAFIDDNMENCVAVKAIRPECKVFLKSTSHNRQYENASLVRVESLNAMYEQLSGKGCADGEGK